MTDPSHKKNIKFFALLLLASFLLMGLFALSARPFPVEASVPPLQSTPGLINRVPMSDEACLECHEDPDLILPLPSGEQVSLSVDRIEFKTSVHGRNGYACVQCHTDITGFPHPEREFETRRDLTSYMSQTCANCHEEPSEEYLMGAHAAAQAAGDTEAAVCADCHGSHTIRAFGNLRTRIAQACRQCHSEIYDIYKGSIHGKALLEDFNPDVPACINCHGNHNSVGPTQEGFHLFSPQVCAQCHADKELMARYDINTNVFETYLSDFHGTTVMIFERIAPDQETNKPVCIDCHGVHNILPPDDVDSTVFKQNLLETCQRCHPDATPNFPDSWLRHYKPDLENDPIVFLVKLFYRFFIPGTLGIMGIFVISDFWRNNIRGRKNDQDGGANI